MKTAAFLTVALIALCSTPAAADRNKKPTQWSVACQILLLVVASQFLCCSRAEAPRLQSAKEAANDKKALGASSKAEQVMKCSPLSGADQIWSRPALQWVLIGEQHGNNETPAAFFNLVCDALVKRKQVTVAVEHPVDEQAALDGIVMSPDFESAQRVLLNQPSWKNGMDGRASSAMLLLLVSLRELHPKFPALTVAAYDVSLSANIDFPARERAIGRKLLSLAKPDHLVLALTGSLHAVEEPRFGHSMAAMYLPAKKRLSLEVTDRGGESWERSPEGCGPIKDSVQAKGGPTASGVLLNPTLAPDGKYDGVLSLGAPLTPSPPAAGIPVPIPTCRTQFLANHPNLPH